MRNQKKLILRQLDDKLKPFKDAGRTLLPKAGWIYTIRKSLGMTLEQIGTKLGMTRQGVRSLEERERLGSISLKSMRDIGGAMDAKFVYGFVPYDGSFEKLVERKAEALAINIVKRTHQNMILEGQENTNKQIQQAIKELSEELEREMPKALWD